MTTMELADASAGELTLSSLSPPASRVVSSMRVSEGSSGTEDREEGVPEGLEGTTPGREDVTESSSGLGTSVGSSVEIVVTPLPRTPMTP
jgi:hypothetical protein